MKIDDVHPELAARITQYQRARDFLEGSDALKAHDMGSSSGSVQVTDSRDRKPFGNGGGVSYGDPRSAYLPRLSSAQNRSDYNTYVLGALYPNYLQKTRENFRGLIFSKAPVIDIPAAINYMLEDCDYRGTPLEEALESVIDELYAVSGGGWWIDRPATAEGMSKLDEERASLRPYIVAYRREDIVNWEYIRQGSKVVLGRVVLKECDDYRELRLIERNGGWAYAVREWEKADRGVVGDMIAKTFGGADYIPGPDEFPQMNGKDIPEIPFYFFSPFGGDACPGKPLLEDLVQCAWSLYQSSALLEHARFTCGLATAFAPGMLEDEAAKLELGGLNVIIASNPDAKFSWVERKGEDCLPLERAVEQKTEMLIRLGSKALEEAKKDAESAQALRIRSSGDTATCADIAQAVGRIAGQALSFCARWMGIDAPATVQLATDYAENVADPQEIAALTTAVEKGKLSQADYNARLRKVGIIEADRTDEIIAAELETENQKRQEAQAGSLAMLMARQASGAPTA